MLARSSSLNIFPLFINPYGYIPLLLTLSACLPHPGADGPFLPAGLEVGVVILFGAGPVGEFLLLRVPLNTAGCAGGTEAGEILGALEPVTD